MKKDIALVYGGYTTEDVISEKSAQFIYRSLQHSKKYALLPTYLDMSKNWYITPDFKNRIPLEESEYTFFNEKQKKKFDGAFIMIHGSPGEDGILQGFFETLSVPYLACGVLCSSLTMDKHLTKNAVKDISDLYVADAVLISKNNIGQLEQHMDTIAFPVFVKANSGGSSFDVLLCQSKKEAFDAVQSILERSDEVLIEQKINGKEYSVGLYQYKKQIHVLPITEIISHGAFFDYAAKYEGASDEITPADISNEHKHRIEEVFIKVYKRLNCRGVVRADFFLEEQSNKIYFLEINTVPGQSSVSIVPQQVEHSGIAHADFYERLLDEAMM